MNKLSFTVVAALVAGAISGWAQTNAFNITKFNGTLVIAGQSGATKIVGSDITQNPVVLLVNETDNTAEFLEVTGPDTTNSLFTAFSAAFTGNGKFTFDFYGCLTPVNGSLPPFEGEVICVSKLSPAVNPKSVKVSLLGVWSDPNHPNDCRGDVVPAATFKGVATGSK